ncbi:MAG TPA: LuxR C-terminal-related transcriptional regulator [Burkholderiales bacterium]|nr:LuxR C-terminal-related transcriptional regulator [Burkholderiales bacterium]
MNASVSNSSHLDSAHDLAKLPISEASGFVPVSLVMRGGLILLLDPKASAKGAAEFAEYATTRPELASDGVSPSPAKIVRETDEHAATPGAPTAPVLDSRKAVRARLTPRQLEVLELLCEGLPNKLICQRLSISTGTVKVHIGGILRELGVSSRLQAVVSARRCGLVSSASRRALREANGCPSADVPAA